jgi:hypothetical protein
VKPWTPFERLRVWRPPPPLTEGDGSMCFVNSRYSVVVVPLPGGWTWLSIQRRDGSPVRRWRDLQRIKNELAGPEREAVEVFPAESRLHDPCNAYDLWVCPAGQRVPFGWNYRDVLNVEQAAARGLRQEPVED